MFAFQFKYYDIISDITIYQYGVESVDKRALHRDFKTAFIEPIGQNVFRALNKILPEP